MGKSYWSAKLYKLEQTNKQTNNHQNHNTKYSCLVCIYLTSKRKQNTPEGSFAVSQGLLESKVSISIFADVLFPLCEN